MFYSKWMKLELTTHEPLRRGPVLGPSFQDSGLICGGGPAGEGRARAFSQFGSGRYNDSSLWLLGFKILTECTDKGSWQELRESARTEVN